MVSRQLQVAFLGLMTIALMAACSKKSADSHVQDGDRYLSESLVKEAVVEYRSAVNLEPDRGDLRLKLADAFMLVPDTLGGLREYVRAADLLPNDAGAQVKAGTMLLMAGAYEDAEARARSAIALDPTNASALLLLGNALAGLKNFDAALSQYQQALAVRPAQDAAHMAIAKIQVGLGQSAEAEATFRKALQTAPDSPAVPLTFGHFLWASDRLEEAEAMFSKAFAMSPSDESVNSALGTFFVYTNRPERAEQHFKTIAKNTNTPAAFLSLADYYVYFGRFDEARRILKDLAGQEISRDAAMLRDAGIDLAEGNRPSALSKVRQVLERRPSELAAQMLLARLLLLDGKPDDAFAQATRIVEQDVNGPFAADAYLLIAQVDAANDRLEDAIRAYEEVLKRQPRSIPANLALGNIHLVSGSTDQARKSAEAVLASQSDHLEARALMVRILVAASNLAEARSMLASLEKEAPNSAAVLYLQGSVQFAEGRADAARASFTKAAALAPGNVQVVAGLVNLDLAAGRVQDATARVESALKTSRSAELLLLAARVFAAARNTARVEEVLLEAIEQQPSRMRPYTLLGAMYAGQQRLDYARERFQEAIERNPSSAATRTVLGMVLEMGGRPADAEREYKQALAVDPAFPVAANNLAWLYVSSNRNLDEALQLAQTALKGARDDGNVNDTLGWIYYRKNMFAPAIQHLEFAVKQQPDDASTHHHLGMAYFRAGYLDKAKQSLQRALTLAPDFDGAAEARGIVGN